MISRHRPGDLLKSGFPSRKEDLQSSTGLLQAPIATRFNWAFYPSGTPTAKLHFKLMGLCTASFTLLDAPLTLAQLAGHLATRKNFLIHPCRERALRSLQIVAGPYGYDVVFDPEMELVALQYRHSLEPCLCEAPANHLSATQQMRLAAH